MKISEIVKASKGRLISGNAQAEIDLSLISTDSRAIKAGEFFLPLKGKNFNGEKFIEDAFKRGAVGTFTTQNTDYSMHSGKIVIQVKDTIDALQRIAHHNRTRFNIPVVGVTGSNGKTTAKEMIAKVLSVKFNVLKNEGTKNNHIGVPLTLLKLNGAHHLCVIEMGTNHRGEIRSLADIARPTIAVITNIGPSHLEYFKDLKGVFNAKREILERLGRNSRAIFNGDDEHLSKIRNTTFGIMRFGFGKKNDFRASGVSGDGAVIRFFLNDRSSFELNLIGLHNVYNALCAIAVAYHFDISYLDTKRALQEFTPSDMRLNLRRIGDITVIDDAYNSNPLSLKAALETLAAYPAQKRWMVSADMLELGKAEKELHGEIGQTIAGSGLNGLITFGNLSRFTSSRAVECGMDRERVWHCESREEVAGLLKRMAGNGDVILVKGSRAMKMEEVINNLKGA